MERRVPILLLCKTFGAWAHTRLTRAQNWASDRLEPSACKCTARMKSLVSHSMCPQFNSHISTLLVLSWQQYLPPCLQAGSHQYSSNNVSITNKYRHTLWWLPTSQQESCNACLQSPSHLRHICRMHQQSQLAWEKIQGHFQTTWDYIIMPRITKFKR